MFSFQIKINCCILVLLELIALSMNSKHFYGMIMLKRNYFDYNQHCDQGMLIQTLLYSLVFPFTLALPKARVPLAIR